MKRTFVVGFFFTLLSVACNNTSVSAANEGARGLSLDQKLDIIVQQHKEMRKGIPQDLRKRLPPNADEEISESEMNNIEVWSKIATSPCQYLPEAVKLIQSERNNVTKDLILIYSMESLPLKDYVTIWGPAVAQGYLKGFVRREDLIFVIFPPKDPRTDFYLGHQEKPVREFYTSLLKEKRIAETPDNDETVGKYIKELLNGSTAAEIRVMQQQGVIGDGTPVNLTTTCATKKP